MLDFKMGSYIVIFHRNAPFGKLLPDVFQLSTILPPIFPFPGQCPKANQVLRSVVNLRIDERFHPAAVDRQADALGEEAIALLLYILGLGGAVG